MAAPKKKHKRVKHIGIWTTEKEYEKIHTKAKMLGIKAGPYLRNLALNYPIKSVVDQVALDELTKAKADLGRVGGLFKKWLSNDANTKVKLGSKSYAEVVHIVAELEKKEEVLLNCAKRLVKELK